MVNIEKINKIFLFVLTLFVLNFYNIKFIEEGSIINLSAKLYIIFFSLISLVYFFKSKIYLFDKAIKLILLSMFVSTFMAYFFWDQNWLNTFRITLPYMLFALIYYLQKTKIDVETIENYLLFFGILYIIIFFFQLVNPDDIIFGHRKIGVQRGVERLVLDGYGFYIVAIFISLSRLSYCVKNYRKYYLTIIILGILVCLLQATRQNIFAIIFMISFHLLSDVSIFKRFIFILISLAAMIYINYFDNTIIDGIVEVTKQESEDVDENVRFVSATFFLTEYSPSLTNRVFGNGVSNGSYSEFGKYDANLLENYQIDKSDVGFFGFYAMFGLLGILGYIFIWIKSLKININKRYYYVKYFLWYIFFTSFTSYSMIKIDMFYITILMIYVYQKVYREQLVF